jgi:hypothetical protein
VQDRIRVGVEPKVATCVEIGDEMDSGSQGTAPEVEKYLTSFQTYRPQKPELKRSNLIPQATYISPMPTLE